MTEAGKFRANYTLWIQPDARDPSTVEDFNRSNLCNLYDSGYGRALFTLLDRAISSRSRILSSTARPTASEPGCVEYLRRYAARAA